MFTPAVQFLILCNVAVYLAENLLGIRWVGMLALWPLGPQFHPWQMVTYAFIHGGLAHIAFNMLGLAVFEPISSGCRAARDLSIATSFRCLRRPRRSCCSPP